MTDSSVDVAIDDKLIPTTDGNTLRRAYSTFPSGVVAVCGRHLDGSPIGLAASAFCPVSLDPPLVSLCVQRTSTTWPLLAQAPVIGVSVFAEEHSWASRQLSGPAADRFTDMALETTREGGVFLPNTAAQLSCIIEEQVPAGDHWLILLRVQALRADPTVAPLVFHASAYTSLTST